ncbi:hypothetical protein AB0D38_46955, partial [Streptomyces sp. NPDC048279]
MLAGAALAGASPAGAVPGAGQLASGVTYREFDVPAHRGTVHAHLLTVDLTDPHVRVDLLTAGSTRPAPPSPGLFTQTTAPG